VKTSAPRVVLTHGERHRILEELRAVLATVEVVEEHLMVASARSGTAVSAWTEARLDALRVAAVELSQQVERAPLGGD
jgi:hypothetical protein